MFRQIVRSKQKLEHEKCIEILKNEPRGVLSVVTPEGYPYAMPMNHWYCEETGKLYFHTGLNGHRTDCLKECNKASFCVYDKGFIREGEWALNISSVIVFGRINTVSDDEMRKKLIRELSHKFTQDDDYIESEINRLLDITLCLELDIEHMTGKLVNEA